MTKEIIIVGAGPAGLMAAYELTKQGKKVLILESRDRIGGRAHTTEDGLESGAEFVHGNLPITLGLLKEAGLSYTATEGEWIQQKGGDQAEAFDDQAWPMLLRKLKALEEDMSLQDFLSEYFSEEKYSALKDQAIGYAEGYDTADASRVSAKALCEEWTADHEEQYRIDAGYSALMNYLAAEITAGGGRILLDHSVSDILPADKTVSVTAAGETFDAEKVLIALPLGVLQAEEIGPRLVVDATYLIALRQLGFGDVIKFVFRFRKPFWEETYPGLGFLISGAPVPTWWTQAPRRDGVFTGWMAGRAARTHMNMPTAQLRDIALDSLAVLFSRDRTDIETLLECSHIANWSAAPDTRGAYAYATIGAAVSVDVLMKPLNGCIFFAGEYMYDGPAMGTVEAALWSGQQTAARLLAGD